MSKRQCSAGYLANDVVWTPRLDFTHIFDDKNTFIYVDQDNNDDLYWC